MVATEQHAGVQTQLQIQAACILRREGSRLSDVAEGLEGGLPPFEGEFEGRIDDLLPPVVEDDDLPSGAGDPSDVPAHKKSKRNSSSQHDGESMCTAERKPGDAMACQTLDSFVDFVSEPCVGLSRLLEA